MEIAGASGHLEPTGHKPPEGFLDGSVFDIAHRLLEAYETDYRWQVTHSPAADLETVALSLAVIDRQRMRLELGDEELALSLAKQAQQQVDELQRGERQVVSGQANLLGERELARHQIQ